MSELYQDLSALLGERQDAKAYLSEYDQRVPFAREWKRRVAMFDAMYRGDWSVVFPDESRILERPKVPNVVRLAPTIRSAAASSVRPTVRADYVQEKKQQRASKRERIAYNYLRLWRYDVQSPRYFLDREATGVNFRIVLPDFESGYPTCRRIDPRFAYPDRAYDPDRPYESFVVAYQLKAAAVRAMNGQAYSELRAMRHTEFERTDLIDIIEYYDSSECIQCAAFSQDGKRYGTTLSAYPNLAGCMPVVTSALPTIDGEFRGEFDDVLGVLQAQNRNFTLLLDYLAEMIYAPVAVDDGVQNPEDIGPGAITRYSKNPPTRIQPANASPEVFRVLADLGNAARVAANFPEGLTGQVQQSIVSAAGVNSLMASYFTQIALEQRLEAAALEETMRLAFKVDEKYHDQRKDMSGVANGQAYEETYKPSADIKGNHRVRVVYGTGEGSDAFSKEIRLTQQVNAGLIPKRLAREQLGSIENVDMAERLLDEEALKAAGLAFIQQQASQGIWAPASAYLAAIGGAGDPLLTLAQFASIQQGQTPGNAISDASSIARGGQGLPPAKTNIPGVGQPLAGVQATTQSLAGEKGGVPLPPLDSIMLRG